MAETIIITEQDRLDAENIIEQYLGDKFPNADFSKGSALRDFVVGSMAYIFAYWKRERDLGLARQSLLLLGKLADTEIDDAVDEILSNWFINRNDGVLARGTVTIYFSQQVDVQIPTTTRFYKTPNLVFVPDSTITLLYDSTDMNEVIDENGDVVAYTLRVPIKAAAEGSEYNIEKGSFSDFTRFSPYISRVENENKFSNASDKESTSAMLDRSETAISERSLNAARSIDAVLRNNFANISRVTVIGYGDAEMIRDLVVEEATNTRIHAGGYVDAFVRLPLIEAKTFEGAVGGEFTDPREKVIILRDDTVADFVAAGVAVGDVINVHNADLTTEANLYVIKRVTPYGVYVSQRSTFPELRPEVLGTYDDGSVSHVGVENRITSASEYTFSSDDLGKYVRVRDASIATNNGTGMIQSVNTVSNYVVVTGLNNNYTAESGLTFEIQEDVVDYSIGSNSPNYNNKISRPSGHRYSGRFTRTIQNDGRILMPAEPVYRITDVSLPGSGYPPALVDTDGRVRFPYRVNQAPVAVASVADLEYQVIGNNPEETHSGWQVLEVNVAWPTPDEDKFNGSTMRVEYDSVSGFDAVWAFMLGTDRRIECGSVIPRGYHPVYLTLNVEYKLSKTATSNLDEDDATDALVEFINSFDPQHDIDVSDIVAFLRSNYSELGYIAPMTIAYQLLSPDGRVIGYQTSDIVEIEESKETGTVAADQLGDPLQYGISDNNVLYLTVADLITFTNLDA